MKTTSVTERLAGLGGAKWGVHLKARDLIKAGADIVEMTIGEPDVPVPDALVEATVASLRAQRTGYSNGRGEAGLLDALAARYSASRGRAFEPGNFLCFPGTQTALFAAMAGVAEAGDEVLVGDPLYATVTIRDQRFYKKAAFGGTLGVADAFIQGWWTCDNLTDLHRARRHRTHRGR